MFFLARILLITVTAFSFGSCLLAQTSRALMESDDFGVTPEYFLFQLKSRDGEEYKSLFLAPENWLTSQNVSALFSHVYDARCSKSALNYLSSNILATRTSVGHEARRLILGYCERRYPQVVNTVPINIADLRGKLRERLESEDGGAALWTALAPKIDKAVAASKARRSGQLLLVFSEGVFGRRPLYADEMLVTYSKHQGVGLNGVATTYEQLAQIIEQRSISCLILSIEKPLDFTLQDVQGVVKGVASQIDSLEKQVVFDLDF